MEVTTLLVVQQSVVWRSAQIRLLFVFMVTSELSKHASSSFCYSLFHYISCAFWTFPEETKDRKLILKNENSGQNRRPPEQRAGRWPETCFQLTMALAVNVIRCILQGCNPTPPPPTIPGLLSSSMISQRIIAWSCHLDYTTKNFSLLSHL